ncbi:acetyltransferase [Vibrio cholerae]|nr:acetyltransferase [Vibrio cholerae]
MVAVVVFEFSVMRCQPLRRALAVLEAQFGFSVFYSG